MPSHREIATAGLAASANGTGYVSSISADDMTGEITGGLVVPSRYASMASA
jgi:hypothetical protein